MHHPVDPELAAIAAYESDLNAALASANLRSLLGARSLTEVAATKTPDWLIPGFIQRGSIHVLSSESGTGKTWLALQSMLAGATNTPFLDHPLPRPFDTVFLGADSPDWDLGQQLRQLSLATGVTLPKNSASVLLPYGLNLLNAEHVKCLFDYVFNFGIDLIALDVLLYTYGGADENSNTDMAKVFHNLKFLRDKTGCAILALHHWKKGADIERGAGTITQAAEHTYVLRKEGDGSVVLERRKIRGEKDWAYLPLRLTPGPSGGLSFVKSDPAPPLLLTWFTFSRTMSRAQLLEKAIAAGYSSGWLGNQLTAAKRDGTLTTDGKGNWTIVAPFPEGYVPSNLPNAN